MKLVYSLAAAAGLWLTAAAPAAAQVGGQQGTFVLCPKFATIEATEVTGWKAVSKTSESFIKAQVETGPAWNGATLVCSYGMAGNVLGMLGQAPPSGTRCTIDAGNPAQFNCLSINVGEMTKTKVPH